MSPHVLSVCAVALFSTAVSADDWNQWLGNQRDAVWREAGILRQFPPSGPPVRWRVPIGPGYSGPSVAHGRLFVMDRQPQLDSDGNPVSADGYLQGTERVLCLDSGNGESLWTVAYDCPYKISYPSGPRTTPLVDGDRIYALGAMGRLMSLDANTGKTIWELELTERLRRPRPGVGILHASVARRRFPDHASRWQGIGRCRAEQRDGTEIWKSLTVKEVGYAPPIMDHANGRRQVIVWLDTAIYGLDPGTGKPFWSVKFPEDPPQRPVVPIMTPQIYDDVLFVSEFYDGSIALKLTSQPMGAEVLWTSDKVQDANFDNSLNAIMTTPQIVDGHIYGIAGFGELRCLDLRTGELKWREIAPTGNEPAFLATAFLVRHDDRFFLFNDQGDLLIARLNPTGYEELGRGASHRARRLHTRTKICLVPSGVCRTGHVRSQRQRAHPCRFARLSPAATPGEAWRCL